MKFYKLIIPKGFKGSAASMSGSCGSDGALFDLVPDNFVGVNIKKCCQIHDYLYGLGGTESDKEKADLMFYTNLKRTVLNDSNLVLRTTNLWLAKVYYKAVRDYGKSSFNYSKNEKIT